MKRRTFIKSTAQGAAALATSPLLSCSSQSKVLKISLAQWSLHRAFSDASLIAGIVQEVNMSNFGTLPDFGNWCLSAKSYNFNEKGEDSKIDYYKMLEIVKKSDYDGYIGIEYEDEILGEHEGIFATKALMEKAWNSLS